MRRDGPMKFEEDFDFETANAQFHKDEIDKELQNKLKLKGTASTHLSPEGQRQETNYRLKNKSTAFIFHQCRTVFISSLGFTVSNTKHSTVLVVTLLIVGDCL